jgi:hypothetical protein
MNAKQHRSFYAFRHGYNTSAVTVVSFLFETDKLGHQLQQKNKVL